jgi:hypothetical protein
MHISNTSSAIQQQKQAAEWVPALGCLLASSTNAPLAMYGVTQSTW